MQARRIRDRLLNSKAAHCFRVWEYLKNNHLTNQRVSKYSYLDSNDYNTQIIIHKL